MSEIFGQMYAPLYDAFYSEKNYDAETELLTQIFRRYARQSVKTVLDLGCGTGNHSLRLAARGYEVTGMDRSKEMLAIADQKASAQALKLRFRHNDIRSFDLGETFDAVLMMFAVLGYQAGDADILSALRTARHHLPRGGLLICDVWYGPAVRAQGTQERSRTVRSNGQTWKRISSGQLEVQHNLCHVQIHLQQMQGDAVVTQVKETHTVRYLFPEEIERFLEHSEFQLLRLGEFPTFDCQPNENTWNVLAVATAV